MSVTSRNPVQGPHPRRPGARPPGARRPGARRLGAVAAALLFTLSTSVALASEAAAAPTACAAFGCDNHNPNVQSWSWGPTTPRGEPHPFGAIDLRAGTTDGDHYAWARATYPLGAGSAYVYVNRRNSDGTGFEGRLGPRGIGQQGWSTSAGTNTVATWSGMYYDPPYKQVQACIHINSDGRSYCTGWY
ncbi:hypothetical protein LG634_06025 [Streptomyces bambusae]|uniref:hypothetical protein n=1 Tax=Streptomyces bambusae TaxID=1550616 RepID=UPI001CFE01A5|nr:hypothetical protein [Streptomyces bambusae]MCB5164391.1 hypothetical protein [Streptomyces bambusae]